MNQRSGLASRRRRPHTEERGVIMVGALIMTIFFLTISIAAAEFATGHYTSTRRTLQASSALNAAEAGAEAFMNKINLDSTYQGTNNAPASATDSCTSYTQTPVILVSNTIQGKITYQTCVKNGSSATEKLVYATARVYLPETDVSPRVTRKIRLVINQTAGATYNIMSGPGGLNISNNVHIASGPLYVGGKLTIGGNATIGTAQAPTSVYVADKSCPSPATSSYPLICPSGSMSITTANGVAVYGDTHVANSVDNTTRFSLPGVTQNDSIPPISLPPADHATLTSGITNTGSMASQICSGGVMHLSGHYTGSSTTNMSLANNCTVILDGTTWIDGNLIFGNNNSLSISNSLATSPNLIIDGATGFDSGKGGGVLTNSSGVGVSMYTFWSTDSSCSPNCANVTGSNLATSQAATTINLDNNFLGASNTKFYSRWTGLIIGNNATIGQLIGQRIDLNNNGSLVFNLSSGGAAATSWNVRYYEQLYK